MSRPNPTTLFGFLVAVLGVMGGMALLKGGLFVAKHEADTLHLLQNVLRMDAGQWPHLDYMTPIGVLAYAPIAFFVSQGAGMGHAIIYAQIGLGAVLLPAVWWIGISRFQNQLAYLFGAIVIIMATALAFGLSEPSISVSMHYNRWAWAISFVAIGASVLPDNQRSCPLADGLIIGLAMAMLALLKVTYFTAFAPAILVAMLLRKSYRALLVSAITGLLVVFLVSLIAGFEFWFSYLSDVLLVARSDVRPQPGFDFLTLVFGPAYIGATAVAALGVMLKFQSGDRKTAVALLLLIPGFIYVTFQNFGNDPQWLPMLGVLLLAMPSETISLNRWGWDISKVGAITGISAFALGAPSLINLAISPYNHLKVVSAWYQPVLEKGSVHDDFQGISLRLTSVDADRPLIPGHAMFETLEKTASRAELAVLQGEELPRCEISLGLPGWINLIAKDLQQTGLLAGKYLFVADMFPSFWMYADFAPLPQGAPWYYGGLSGFDNADYLMVPLCPAEAKVRRRILQEIVERGDVSLKEVRRTELYILLKILRE